MTIGIISRNNNALASLVAQISSETTGMVEPRELRVLLQDTGQLACETGELLMRLQKTEGQSARQRTMLSKLSRDFQFVLRRFQQLAQQASQHVRQRHVNRPQGDGSAATLSDQERLYDEQVGLLEADHMQQLIHQKLEREAVARANLHILEEREQMIKQVETTVGEVNEIFGDLAGLVSEQGIVVDHISIAIEKTVAQTSMASGELRHASHNRQRERSRTCCLYVGVVLASVFILLIVSSK